jgi:gamma-glutamyltranspeptidase
MGYTIINVSDFGRVDAIMFPDDKNMTGHSDKRGYGKALGY